MEDRKPTLCTIKAGQLTEPVASDKFIKWLTARRTKLQKEHDEAEDLNVRKAKGARLKQIKDCLHYIYTH
jgi:hypothetical protein